MNEQTRRICSRLLMLVVLLGYSSDVVIGQSRATREATPGHSEITRGGPLGVIIASFDVAPHGGDIRIDWATASEVLCLGFNLHRSSISPDGPYQFLNDSLVPCQVPGSPTGADYTWTDGDVQPGTTYYFKLEAVNIYGMSIFEGPESATARFVVYMPMMVIKGD